MLILHAARQVVEADGFDELLDSVRERVDEIESLHRTRELTVRFNLNRRASFHLMDNVVQRSRWR